MACRICGGGACIESFHSIEDQEAHEAMQNPQVRDRIAELEREVDGVVNRATETEMQDARRIAALEKQTKRQDAVIADALKQYDALEAAIATRERIADTQAKTIDDLTAALKRERVMRRALADRVPPLIGIASADMSMWGDHVTGARKALAASRALDGDKVKEGK